MNQRRISGKDLRAIEQQLRREPRGIIEVIKRCKQGLPLVILTFPFLEDQAPFPILFWLTCPKLVKSVSKLEDEGMAKLWQQRITKSKRLAELLQEAQSDYQQRLSKLVKRQICSHQNQAKFEKQFDYAHYKGIGGVEDSNKIKCLHAHYAHFLATGKNPVGEMVAEALGDFRCQKMCLKI